jgi:hypothetical protein
MGRNTLRRALPFVVLPLFLAAMAVADVTNGLVLHYTFDDYDGSNVVDESGTGNRGTVHGATFTLDGAIAGAYAFDGVDDYIDCGGDASLQITEAVTYAVWMKTTSPGQWGAVLGRRSAADSHDLASYMWHTSSGNLGMRICDEDWGERQSVVSGRVVDDGDWHHIVGVYEPDAEITIYIDGVQAGQRMNSVLPDLNAGVLPVSIGRATAGTGYHDGLLDDVRIYNRALGSNDVAHLYSSAITNGVRLWVAGDPDTHGAPTPYGYGSNWLAVGTAVTEFVSSPVSQITGMQYRCTGWAGTGDVPATGSSNSVTFTVTQDSSLAWQWQTEYELQLAAGDGGSIDRLSGWYLEGTTVVVTASASNGYAFAGWTGDIPAGSETNNPLHVTADHPRSVTATFSETLPDDGLVLHYTFDDYDGTNLTDHSGNGLHGVVHGAERIPDGAVGAGYAFDGSTDYVSCDAVMPALAARRAGTIAFWARLAADDGDQHLAFSLLKAGNTREAALLVNLDLRANSDCVIACIYLDQARPWALKTPADTLDAHIGEWLHVAIVHDGTEAGIYLNGELQQGSFYVDVDRTDWFSSVLSDATPPADMCNLGAMQVSGADRFNMHGDMDDLRIYNVPLSSNEVAQLCARIPETPDLVLHYTFDDYDGSNVVDESGTGNTGTVYGAAFTSNGVMGGAYTLDGVDDYIDCGADASLQITSNLTYCAWIKPASGAGLPGYVMGRRAGSMSHQIGSFLSTYPQGDAYFEVNDGSGVPSLKVRSGAVTVDDGAWYHLAGVYESGASTRLYVNGELAASHTGTVFQALNGRHIPMHIGAWLGHQHLEGCIDDVRVYARALSSNDVTQLFEEAGYTPPLEQDGPILHYTFDSDTGTNVWDSSGNGNHGYTVGAITYEVSEKGGQTPVLSSPNTYIVCPSEQVRMDGWGALTVATWVRMKNYTTYGIVMARSQNRYVAGTSGNMSLGVGGEYRGSWVTGRFWIKTNDTAAATIFSDAFGTGATPYPSLDAWYHIAVTYDGTNLSYYIDGALDTNLAVSVPGIPIRDADDTALLIGKQGGYGFNWSDAYLNGNVDDVRIYDRALSASEIADLSAPGQENGLVLHYTFDDHDGSNVVDESGTGNTGTVHGADFVPYGAVGGAYSFDGSDDRVDCGGDASLQITGSLTYAAWIRTTATRQGVVVGRRSGVTATSIASHLSMHDDGWIALGICSGANEPGQTLYSYGQPVNDGVWHHVACVYDAGRSLRLYLDGEQIAARTNAVFTSLNPRALPVLVGARSGAGFFDGEIDDVRIYNGVLGADAIEELAGMGPNEGLVLHYTFDDYDGSNVVDESGTGNTGTVYGAGFVSNGVVGSAYAFDGVDDYVDCGVDASLQITGALTYAVWVRTTHSGSGQTLVGRLSGATAGTTASHLTQNSGRGVNPAGTVQWTVSNAAADSSRWCHSRDDALINDGFWHHVVGVFVPGIHTIQYIDGEEVGRYDTNMIDFLTRHFVPLYVGCAGSGRYHFEGEIDDVRIYSRALSSNDAARLFDDAGYVPPALEPELIAHYMFDGSSSNVLADSSGNGYDGTIHGATPLSGKIDGAYYFDGSDDYVDVDPLLAGLVSNTTGTVAFWAKMDPDDDVEHVVFSVSRETDAARSDFLVSLDWRRDLDFLYARLTVDNEVQWIGTGPEGMLDGLDGQWLHVAVTHDGTRPMLYMDGRPISVGFQVSAGLDKWFSSLFPGALSPADTANIGMIEIGSTDGLQFGGAVDDLRVYGQALTSNQVAELAADVPADPDLVLHYTFDEHDGIAVADESGLGNEGTVHGAAFTSNGVIGGAYVLDGVDDYIDCGASASLQITSNLTYSAWIKLASGAGLPAYVVGRRAGPTSQQIASFLSSYPAGDAYFEVNDGSGVPSVRIRSGAITVDDGAWYHLVGVYHAGDSTRLYVNGQIASSHTGTVFHALNGRHIPMQIGAWLGHQHLEGCIDDVRVYRRALSSNDVSQLFEDAEYEPPSPNDDLVLHYTFDEYDGATVADESGTGNNGTVYGAGFVPEGVIEGSYSFDGTDDRIDCGTDSSLQIAGSLTYSAWIRTTATRQGGVVGRRSGVSATTIASHMSMHDDGWIAFGICSGANEPAQALYSYGQAVNDGVWHHVAGVYDAGRSLRLYLDGDEVSERTNAVFSSLNSRVLPVLVGARSGAGYFDGEIDDVRVYARALSSTDVAQLFDDAGYRPPTPGTNLIAHYTFDGSSSSVLADDSGNGYAGTIHGATPAAGKISGAYYFDGSNDYVDVDSVVGALVSNTAGTVAFWAKMDSDDDVEHVVFSVSRDTDSTRSDFLVALDWRRNLDFLYARLTVDDQVQWMGVGPEGMLAGLAGQWLHVAVTHDGVRPAWYVNGRLVPTTLLVDVGLDKWFKSILADAASSADTANIGMLEIGSLDRGQFGGAIDDLRIYGRALSSNEVAELCETDGPGLVELVVEAGEGGTVEPGSGLFEEGTAMELTALSSNGYTFVAWQGDVPPGSQFSNPMGIVMDRARTVRAVFWNTTQMLGLHWNETGTYFPGENTIHCRFYMPDVDELMSLVWTPALPGDWSLVGAEGDGGPRVLGNEIVFTRRHVREPVEFSYTVAVPAGTSEPRSVGGVATYQIPGMPNPEGLTVLPDPLALTMHDEDYHSADYRDHRWVIDAHELSRVLFYWRTGWYRPDPEGYDGYTASAEPYSGWGPLHSADYRRPHWRIRALEANRVLAYWRAGGFRADPDGRDGYASARGVPGVPPPAPMASADSGQAAKGRGTPVLRMLGQASVEGYDPGGTVTITNVVEFDSELLALCIKPDLPQGWIILDAVAEGDPEVAHDEILWTGSLPSSPVTIVYTVQVPATCRGTRQVLGLAEAYVSSSANASNVPAPVVQFAMDARDDDGDGLPDGWEEAYAAGTNSLDPGVDSDADGLDNRQEWIAGTDPTNAASVLVLTGLERVEGGMLRLTWQSAVDRRYRIMSADGALGLFTPLQTNLLSTPPANSADVLIPGSPQGLMRVDVRD